MTHRCFTLHQVLVGLPQSDVPLALFSFNLGVEAGQLLFVLPVLALKAIIDRLMVVKLSWARTVTGYGIGSLRRSETL